MIIGLINLKPILRALSIDTHFKGANNTTFSLFLKKITKGIPGKFTRHHSSIFGLTIQPILE